MWCKIKKSGSGIWVYGWFYINKHFTLIEQSATETEEQSSETESVERLVVIEWTLLIVVIHTSSPILD